MEDQSGIISSKGASVFFGVLFIIGALVHVALMLYKRSWAMSWLILGTVLEITSYMSNSAGYGTQSFMAIIAPVFLAASIYISFGKFLRRLDLQGIHSRHILQPILFICADSVSFGLQAAGVVISLIRNRTAGTAMIIAGFTVQIASLSYLLFLVIRAHQKLNNDPVLCDVKGFYSWKSFIKSLYVVFSLLFARYVYRLAEYAEGLGGYIFRHAIFEYVFDAAPMALVVLLLCVVHPSLIEESGQAEKVSVPSIP